MKLYITESAPNGTHDLLIADNSDTIIDCVSEAVFGVRFDAFDVLGNALVLSDGDLISLIKYDDDIMVELKAGDLTEYMSLVQLVSLETVLKSVAVSPVSDGSELIQTLQKHGLTN